MQPTPSESTSAKKRVLGCMVVHSPAAAVIDTDLKLVRELGASRVEVLPRWNALPPADELRDKIERTGLDIWSVHGPWGRQSICAEKVDLADTNPRLRQESLDDLLRASDWAAALDAKVLVVHPGGLSDAEVFTDRYDNLRDSLARLAAAAWPMGLKIGVENMPKGVYPGSRMGDLAKIVREIDHPGLGLVLDTGHARISADVVTETLACEGLLISTHVHDNEGRADSHKPPGEGTIDWPAWFASLDRIGYSGPVVLECIRALRERPDSVSLEWISWWRRLVAGFGKNASDGTPFGTG